MKSKLYSILSYLSSYSQYEIIKLLIEIGKPFSGRVDTMIKELIQYNTKLNKDNKYLVELLIDYIHGDNVEIALKTYTDLLDTIQITNRNQVEAISIEKIDRLNKRISIVDLIKTFGIENTIKILYVITR